MIKPLLAFIIRNMLSGAFWSLGSAAIDAVITARKEGRIMIRTTKLLFHPKVTFGAFAACLVTILTFAPDIKAAFGTRGLLFVIACSVLLTVCTYGRSPASSVDNNQIPK